MNPPDITLQNLSKSFPHYHHVQGGAKNFLFHLPQAIRSLRQTQFEALRDVSFDVHRGETLGIVGRNGAGKSTLLGLIAGVLQPSSGRIDVRERVSPLLELGGGFHPELTGRENILLNGVLLGLLLSEVRKRLDAIIDFSELEPFIDQPIRTYSSGMLARLGFSVVAHLDPRILLIDEVLAVGDAGFQAKCIEKMMEFKRQGTTMVFVSHSPRDVSLICDRVAWLENHTLRALGPAAEVLRDFSQVR
jgi:lipopolysaccharide transport system ATP-binding protein